MSFITAFDHLNLAPPHSLSPQEQKKTCNLEPTAGWTDKLRDHTAQEQDLLNFTTYCPKSQNNTQETAHSSVSLQVQSASHTHIASSWPFNGGVVIRQMTKLW
jgi:hypothetical protein